MYVCVDLSVRPRINQVENSPPCCYHNTQIGAVGSAYGVRTSLPASAVPVVFPGRCSIFFPLESERHFTVGVLGGPFPRLDAGVELLPGEPLKVG